MAIVLVALGSNRCHGRHGRPAGVVRAALVALAGLGLLERVSPIFTRALLNGVSCLILWCWSRPNGGIRRRG